MAWRWLILGAAGAVAAGAWAALGLAYFFMTPGLALWTALVTAAALSTEGFLWIAAGVIGWSIFARRRAILSRLKRALFGAKQD